METKRLSDRILYALQLALEQGDVQVADSLNHALDMSVTRNAGGATFEERRHFDDAYEAAQLKLQQLKERA